MNKKLYIELIFLIILGMLTSLSLPPYNYLIINFLTFSSIFVFLIKKSNKHKDKKYFFIYGWLFGFGYFFSNLYWISISLTYDKNFEFLIPLTIILIPAFLAIFYGLITYFFILLKPRKIIASFFVFSLIFGILEFIRGSILTGFPWNLIVYSFSNQLEFLNITTVIGTYGLNLFCISLFTSPAIFILRETKKDIGICVFFLISVILISINGASHKKKFYNIDKKIYDYKIRAINSKISLDRFYFNTDPTIVIKELIEISDPNINEKTIFVWPEGIIPDTLQKEIKKYDFLFEKHFSKNHLLILGINNQSIINGSKKYFNSLSIYDNKLNLVDSYNKIKLVPFGEFLPLESIFKNIGLKTLTNNYQSFSRGEKREIIKIEEKNFSLKILPLICYEVIYSGEIFNDPNFDLIINISEDGWFGQSIGPKQHLAHSVLRAIESGKYLVRSTNNGVTAIINPLGIIEQRVNPQEIGYIDLKEIRIIQPTIFSKYGNKIFGILILLYIFLIFSFNKIKNE